MAGDDELSALLAVALQRLDEGGSAALESFLSSHAEAAPTLRRRLDLLLGAGMVEPPPGEDGVAGVPDRLGEFVLERRLGSGGMGVVYVAEQPSLRRKVALKLIRPELLYFPNARQRFQREIEAVAALQHPGIVRVHEAGEQGGLPYYTMDLVEGVSLDRLLQALPASAPQRVGEPELREAMVALGGDAAVVGVAFAGRRSWVELVCGWLFQIADALAHAHAAGVLHRDVKPANVVVTWNGRAVLLDFGLACTREGGRLTGSGAQLGSVPYLAPEQVRGDRDAIDARTDVYALGVTMYEALTLRNPFHVAGDSDDEVRRRIEQAAPAPPRLSNPAIGRDVETVCLCAMAPEPARRYQSAALLAADLQNVLALRPPAARRPSLTARLHRLVRRRPAVSTAAAMGFVLLVVAPSVVAIREHRLRTELERARADALLESEIREETLRFLDDDLLAAVAPDAVGREASMRDVLDVASRRVEGRFQDRPEVEAAIRMTLGHTYRKLGVLDAAERHLTRAVELTRAHAGERRRKALVAQHMLASAYHAQGRDEEASRLETDVFAAARAAFGIEDPDTLAAGNNLGLQLTALGRYEQAVAVLQEVLDVRLRVLGEDHAHTQTTMCNLGLAYFDQGRLDLAETWLRRELELTRQTNGDEHPDTIASLNNVANVLLANGRTDEALQMHERLVAASRRVLGENHYRTVTYLVNSARTLGKLRRFDEADARSKEALAAAAGLPADNPSALVARLARVQSLHQQRHYDEALRLLDEVLAAERPGSGDNERLFGEARLMRAWMFEGRGDFERAAASTSELIEAFAGREDVLVRNARQQRAAYLRRLGRYADAEQDLLAVDGFLREHASLADSRGDLLAELVRLYEAWGRTDEAERWRQQQKAWQEDVARRHANR